MATPKKKTEKEEFGAFMLLADIRAAVGDSTGRLMQDDLVERCRRLREVADYIADPSRPAWKSGGRGVAVAKAMAAISDPVSQKKAAK